MADLRDLDRRLSRKIETGRGISLSGEELDLLVVTGAYDTFRAAVADFQRDQCQKRAMKGRSIPGGNTGSNGTGELTEASEPPSSRSSGTTPPADVTGASQRAQRMLQPPKPSLTGSTSNGNGARPCAANVDSPSEPERVTS